MNLYAIEDVQIEEEVPFIHPIKIHGAENNFVEVEALFDDGAMVAVMCSQFFASVRHKLGLFTPSTRQFRLANGFIVHGEAVWRGTIEIGGICIHGSFEVFNSGGSWRFLFGKPLIRPFKAVHAYEFDTVMISSGETLLVLENKFGRRDEGKLEVLVAELGVELKRVAKW